MQALECRIEQGDAHLARVARWCVARVLRSLGRIEEALAQQWALLDEGMAAGEADGYVHEEIGECLLAQGDLEAGGRHDGGSVPHTYSVARKRKKCFADPNALRLQHRGTLQDRRRRARIA